MASIEKRWQTLWVPAIWEGAPVDGAVRAGEQRRWVLGRVGWCWRHRRSGSAQYDLRRRYVAISCHYRLEHWMGVWMCRSRRSIRPRSRRLRRRLYDGYACKRRVVCFAQLKILCGRCLEQPGFGDTFVEPPPSSPLDSNQHGPSLHSSQEALDHSKADEPPDVNPKSAHTIFLFPHVHGFARLEASVEVEEPRK